MEMKNMYLQNIENKEIWCCNSFGTRINMNQSDFSLCHDVAAQGGGTAFGKITDLSPKNYYKALENFARENDNPDFPCRKCPKCSKKRFHFRKLAFITINTSSYCNSHCIYCIGQFGSKEGAYDPINYLKLFHEEQLFEKDCLFDWGGGEPTLNPYFEGAVCWLTENGYCQRINTNAILYSESIAIALCNDKTELRISVDSGTEAGYRKMKGNKNYHLVWDNIKKYAAISNDAMYIKYNVCNYNSNKEEVDAFLRKCSECRIKNIIIDAEISAYQPEKNAGPFYYTEKEYEAMHYMENRAKEKGFHVSISNYAFSYRPEYDKEGNITLPAKYISNIDREIISNGIYLETYPTISGLLEELKNTDRKIVIWGFGMIGRRIYQIMEHNHICVSYLIDLDSQKQGMTALNIPVVSPKEFTRDEDPITVILAGKYWKEMLKTINDSRMLNCNPVYLKDRYWMRYMVDGEER